MGQASDFLRDSSSASHAPRLIDRFRAAIRSRHYSRRTEEAYVHWIKRLIYFHGKRHPRAVVKAGERERDKPHKKLDVWKASMQHPSKTRLAA